MREWYLVHVEASCVADIWVAANSETEAKETGEDIMKERINDGQMNLIFESVTFPEKEVQHETD